MYSTVIKDNILHPNQFNTSDGYGNLELWNKGNTATTINNDYIKKTIFSSSPCNYNEPKSSAFIGFLTSLGQFNVSGSFNKGWNFYCQPNKVGTIIFFPALGYRVIDTSAVAGINGDSGFWSAGPAVLASYSYYLYFSFGNIDPQHVCAPANGLSMRPSIEE